MIALRVLGCALLLCVLSGLPLASAELRVVPLDTTGSWYTEIRDGDTPVFTGFLGGSNLLLSTPSETGNGSVPVAYKRKRESESVLELLDFETGVLNLSETFRIVAPNLIERTVTVKAHKDARYHLDFGWRMAQEGGVRTFTGPETEKAHYCLGFGGPEFGGTSHQTFPFIGYQVEGSLYGLVGDSPGVWENRSCIGYSPEDHMLWLSNGDSSPKRVVTIPRELDATTVYRAQIDGWQHIEVGETQTWTTWIFASPVRSQYDVQLAAHLALANAKGFNQSGLEAILRNTSYLLLRRNLLRPESDYIFISGVGYGWKQWVSDGFYMSRGLDNPVYDAASHAAVFYDRINYEDNAQYYLIWALLVKRAGGDLDMRTVDRAYQFMRAHEVDGLYIPPRLKPELASFKTYHDQLPYDDDDAPSSNQGFHCGALLAARELGYTIADEEIEKAKAGYRRMFNESGGYMATSLKQQEHIGQDSLYGEVLTYAVFGEKLLPDEMVKKHLETTMRIQTPYGMRVISKANGDLLDGHSGVYVFGGSWFLNDGCNYLDGLIHGMDPGWVEEKLLWRLEKELAVMPAFHESISTVDGHPHGHHLYSWNSGFWWLRREVRKHLNMSGPDPLAAALDAKLGIVQREGMLALEPEKATLRPVQ